MSKFDRAIKSYALCLLALSYCYLATFVLMMDWRSQAFDPINRRYTDECVYRFAPVRAFRVPDVITVYVNFAFISWPNRVFWPLDLLCLRRQDCTVSYAGYTRI
jgi:hypothetical protein